jgi:hypothetical protein
VKTVVWVVLAIAIYTGVRYAGSAIHYGCADPAEDCPPPIYLAGELGWYLTGGPLVPLWDRGVRGSRGH